ncbi:MAG: hypothetical protein LUC94_14830 [Clostridiales bacterium]|nr:hypothetical protein [Clostridiales bacterium]
MKRVILFGGRDNRPARDLNKWLSDHPDVELLEVSAVRDDMRNTLLYCTVEIPTDGSGLNEWFLEYFGFQTDKEHDTDESEVRRRLMDCVVDVRVVELHPEGDGKWSKAKPMDSEIDCPALTELLDGSLKYLCAYFEDGWRHSEEEAAEEIRTRTLELLHSISADVLVRDIGTDMCEFVVRLSRWVRQ